MHFLADMQEKGLIEIEEAVEGDYGFAWARDEVLGACAALTSKNVLHRSQDQGGDAYYRRASPLGEDDYSS